MFGGRPDVYRRCLVIFTRVLFGISASPFSDAESNPVGSNIQLCLSRSSLNFGDLANSPHWSVLMYCVLPSAIL